ncbi:hypothetical protein OG762_02055 [Streptomyces sp. NBC_01136]|uniref:hypothetical protein n=1 Tax=unclassified Streptomyces TaxID=2593676 RepID=UPI0032472F35|nr:hypothetical protein OG762_02055 [Streptomyces sp. NBC_01136]
MAVDQGAFEHVQRLGTGVLEEREGFAGLGEGAQGRLDALARGVEEARTRGVEELVEVAYAAAPPHDPRSVPAEAFPVSAGVPGTGSEVGSGIG